MSGQDQDELLILGDDEDDAEVDSDGPGLLVQVRNHLVTVEAVGGTFRVAASMRTDFGSVVVPFVTHTHESLHDATMEVRRIVASWATRFEPQPMDADVDLHPAIVGRAEDGSTITVLYFGEDRWIGLDSLMPDEIFADWTSFEAALEEVIDVAFVPIP